MYRYKLLIVLVMLVSGITLVVRSCQPREAIFIEEETANIYRLNDSLRNAHSDLKETERMERYLRNWMARNNLRGVSFSVMKNEKLIYSKGLGWADKEIEREAEAGDIYRIASASKLITAIGIMKLVDEGKLLTDQLVFGEKGILNEYTEFRDKRAAKITVEHLLNHTSGFSRRLGDPMFRSADVMRWTHKNSTLSSDDLIRFQLNQRLRCAPGESPQYSNIGYMVLSCVIERVSGMSYEQYLQTHVLRPAGCYDMHIARNYYEERYPHEVKYYGHDPGERIESYDGSGARRPREYGGNNITGLQGAGAWVCSSAELLRLVAAIDGKPGIPDILSKRSIEQMNTPRQKNGFAYGWARSHSSVLTRTGTMSGTCSYIEYRPNGISFALIANTSNYRGAKFTNRIGPTVRTALDRVKSWPEGRDLFTSTGMHPTPHPADSIPH